MNSIEITAIVQRAFDKTLEPASAPEILHEVGSGIRPALVDKALEDAVLDGHLLRRRIGGVLRYLPAPSKDAGHPNSTPAITPAPTPKPTTHKGRPRPVPLPMLDLAKLGPPVLRPRVELRNPAERNGGRRWDYLLDHLDTLGPPTKENGTPQLPSLNLPPAYGKAIQAFIRAANKTRAPRQYRVACGTDVCVLQRLA